MCIAHKSANELNCIVDFFEKEKKEIDVRVCKFECSKGWNCIVEDPCQVLKDA